VVAAGKTYIVEVANVSRGGACFVTFDRLTQGESVSVAVHYVEGGQNIFQNARIVRTRPRPSGSLPTEYAVEFVPGTLSSRF
jgi:hypothetical protein